MFADDLSKVILTMRSLKNDTLYWFSYYWGLEPTGMELPDIPKELQERGCFANTRMLRETYGFLMAFEPDHEATLTLGSFLGKNKEHK